MYWPKILCEYIVWTPGTGENRNHWQCLVCDDGRWHPSYNAKQHEASQAHVTQLARWQWRENWAIPNPLESNPRANSFVNDSLIQLLGELQDHRPHNYSPPHSGDDSDTEMATPQSEHAFLQAQDPAQYIVSFDDSDTTQLQPSATDMAISRLAEELESYLFDDFGSESSEDELDEQDMLPEHLGMFPLNNFA